MKIGFIYAGRLGNVIFRYFAYVILSIKYGAEYGEYDMKDGLCFSDKNFLDFIKCDLNNGTYVMDIEKNYDLKGYFQHDLIYVKYKNQIIEHIMNNPNEELITDRKSVFKSINLIEHPDPKKIYKIVVHIRLEDFCEVGWVIHPLCLKNVLENYKNEQICFVMSKINNELEQKYIEFFLKDFDIVIESNDVITDYHIMKNAEILVCSMSTLSWCSVLLSETIKKVYYPEHDLYLNSHTTYKKPIEDTVVFDTILCDRNELEYFFDNYN